MIAEKDLLQQMTNDHIYWTFSAAAQSIAAFVAFLLTGYALVYTLMDAAREKDDTLEEIHTLLRKKYHAYLTLLTCVTGARCGSRNGG